MRRIGAGRRFADVRARDAEPEPRNPPAYIGGMELKHTLTSLSDQELIRRLRELLGQSRRVEADLVAHIGEVDARRLYAREAAPSMFAYCTEVLHLSEAEAYLRIAVARASREHPVLSEMLADGRLHLTSIAKLAPHLTRENRDAVLARASHRSKRDIEALVAELSPRPDAPTVVRRMPEPGADRTASAPVPLELRPDGVGGRTPPAPQPAPPASIEPLAPARYKVQFTASGELIQKLDRLKALMRSSVPDGDLAAILEDAVTEKLARLEARRFARTDTPRKHLGDATSSPRSRYIPAPVRRAVYERDGGRCRYVDAQGRRCTARDRLEYHHRRPFGYGGDHDPDNLSLMCRAHNAYLAEVDYGTERVRRPHGGGHVSEGRATWSRAACTRTPMSSPGSG
jgi:hypothetical protein